MRWITLALGAGTAAVLAATRGEPARPCEPTLKSAVLRDWARAGFSEAEPRAPHAVGRSNRLARRPQTAASDLRIHAQRMDGTDKRGEP